MGITAYLVCTSSYSGGLHLYFPFAVAQPSQRLAYAIKILLHQAGFPLVPGQLELFPNPKPYSQGHTLFNGHRLPLQAGSYLLNADFYPVWTSRDRFVSQWHHCAEQNEITVAALRRALKQQRREYVVSGKANKFLNDLNAEIDPGWTGAGQTNHLLGRIALRTYVFGHLLSGGTPFVGTALVDQIIAVARSLPGYEEWCQHQHELHQRATDWGRCVEASKYYPYGFSQLAGEPAAPRRNWNQEQFDKTAEKIRAAVVDLSQQGLPDGATARFKALISYGIGGGSLYRHKELWHPSYLPNGGGNIQANIKEGKSPELSSATLIEEKENLNLSQSEVSSTTTPAATPTATCTSLFPPVDGDAALSQDCDDSKQAQLGGNSRLVHPLRTALLPPQLAQLPSHACFLSQWRSRQRVSTG
ncbi:MAG: hypothetical protein AAF289_06600 [Cyanobacteria bacterium P01_A01_bin.135]